MIEPVHVHVASMDKGVHLVTSKRHRRLVATYSTQALNAQNAWSELVPQDNNRYCYTVSAGIGPGTALKDDLGVFTARGDALSAAGKALGASMVGMFLAANVVGQAPVVLHGTNPAWIAVLAASPTYPIYIGVAQYIWLDEEDK